MTLHDWVTLYISVAACVALLVLAEDPIDAGGAGLAGLAWPLYVAVMVGLALALVAAMGAAFLTWLAMRAARVLRRAR